VSEGRLTHLDESGRARMVDVGAKPVTERTARARALVRMSPAAARRVAEGDAPKGDVIGVARLAGIQAAKQTAALVPLAHPLELSFVDVEARVDAEEGIVELVAEARTAARTGVEMEAMTACAVAALTVYDMVKGIERGVSIEHVLLLEKHGGRSDYQRERAAESPAAGNRPTAPGTPRRDATAEPSSSSSPPPARAALLTVSTSRSAGHASDESGPAIAQLASRLGLELAAREIVPDDRAAIEARLRHWSDVEPCALVLTSGGTGLAPADVTPEATLAVIEREAPGIAEALRAVSREHTRNWMLSRARAGVRRSTLIVNLPGNPAAIEQSAAELEAPLRHALDLLADRPAHHG
jgi:cyclic pyranopterin monophosphate synthase